MQILEKPRKRDRQSGDDQIPNTDAAMSNIKRRSRAAIYP
jgi:hypothetical protein